MKILQTKPHLSDQELRRIMKKEKTTRLFLDWQIIYSVQTNRGKQAEEFAKMLCVSKHKIYKVIQSYNKYGRDWNKNNNWGGRREARCILSLSEEAKILKNLETSALSGKILIYRYIKKIVEDKIGRKVSDDYIWDLLKRHGWKKKVPRQSHPKSNQEEQNNYKKNSKRIWLPNH